VRLRINYDGAFLRKASVYCFFKRCKAAKRCRCGERTEHHHNVFRSFCGYVIRVYYNVSSLRKCYYVRDKSVRGDLRMVAVKVKTAFFIRLYLFFAHCLHTEFYLAEEKSKWRYENAVNDERGDIVKNIFSDEGKILSDFNLAAFSHSRKVIVKLVAVINGLFLQNGALLNIDVYESILS